MKLHSGLTASSLARVLGETLQKELQTWKPIIYKKTDLISDTERNNAVFGMLLLNKKLKFHPETAGSAIAILDKFLSLVRVPPKYLQCVTTTCLYLAAKTLEEDNVIPSTMDIVRASECGCSLSEILRMELTILKKLNWSLPTTSTIDALHIIYAVLLHHHPRLLVGLSDMTPSRHMSIIVRKLLVCQTDHRLLTFRPLTIVVSMLSLELEQLMVGWFPLISLLQKMTQITNQDLIRCREVMAQHLTLRRQLITPYQKIAESNSKSKKRKVEQIDEEDDIYDSIKRLYNDEHMLDMSSRRTSSCGSDLHHETESDLLHPIHTVYAN